MSVPDLPSNPSPTPGTVDVDPIAPVLTWEAPGATSCSVRIKVASKRVSQPPYGFSGVGILSDGVWTFDRNSGGEPSGGLENITFRLGVYWQVEARNDDGVTLGPIWEFVTKLVGAPDQPNSHSPTGTGISLTPTLTWASDGATSYDVYLGTSLHLVLVSAGQTDASYTPGAELADGTLFEWQIVAHNAVGSTNGPVWDFVTAFKPAMPSAPSPASLSSTHSLASVALSWADDPFSDTYDVYFDTSNPPTTLVSSAQTGHTYTPTPPLTAAVVYYWQIVATNSNGSRSGPVWRFTAEAYAPASAPTLTPAAGAGLPVGSAYQYVYTDVTAAGESVPSPLATITVGGLAAPGWSSSNSHQDNSAAAGDTYEYFTTYGKASTLRDFTQDVDPSETTGAKTLVAGSISGDIQTPLLTVTASSDPAVTYIYVWARKNGGAYYLTVDGGGLSNTTQSVYVDGRLYDGSPSAGGVTYTPSIGPYANHQVALSAIAVGPTGTTGRKVYRTIAGGSQLKLQQTIANNTATTGVQDSTPDGSLGANAPTVDTSGL